MKRSDPDGVTRVAILGAGLIGSGWAACFLGRGIEVLAIDPAPLAADRMRDQIASMAPVLEELGLTNGRADFSRLEVQPEPGPALADVQFVQESLPEKLPLKQDILRRVEDFAAPDIVIASSTSALRISDIQARALHPGRYVAGHPYNPSHLMPLVEVSGGDATEATTVDWAMDFYAHVGKRPVRRARDIEGHIAGRLGAALWREAVSLVEQGIASVADIDAAVRYGPGLRWATMGPHMIYHLGGGEGGLRYYLDHLGASQVKRWQSLGNPALTEELKDRLVAGVLEEADGRSIDDLNRERDRMLLATLRALADKDH